MAYFYNKRIALKKRQIILYFLLLISAAHVFGQSYNFRNYRVENGLSNNSVHAILQDSSGFMWFGTKDGLNRFDGYTFKVFRGNPDDSSSIGSNIIQTLYEDNGEMWVGTDKGLYEYDAKSEKLSLIKFTANKYIRSILRDENDNLWFVADFTLYKFNLETEKLRTFETDKYFFATSICKTPAGVIWVSASSGTIHKYDPRSDTFRSYDIFSKSEETTYHWIETIYSPDDDFLLIGTQSQGIKRFDIPTATYQDVLPFDEDNAELFVRNFVKSGKNEYWAATESGVYIYNDSLNTFTNLKKQYNNPYSISDNAIYAVHKDREGGIWVGSYFGGVSYYPNQYAPFQKFFPKIGENSLSGNAVREICQDKNGDIWIGTEDAGLNKYNPETGVFTNFKPSGNNSSLSHYNIHGLLAIDDELWIGTFHHGLDIMDINTGEIIRHYTAADEPGSIRSNFIYCVYQTRDGTILVGTSEGLYRYNKEKDNFSVLPESTEMYPYTTVVMEDHKGVIWGGTFKEGIYYFDPKTRKIGFYRSDPADPKSLSNNSVTSIYEDSQKNIWVATENGLNMLVSDSRTFKRYTTENGLPSNVIYDILEDEQKILWISTSKGLVRFNPESEKLRVFTKAHGLLTDQLNYSSAFKSAEGEMYIGSVSGMISFNPTKFVKDTFVPPIYITGFQIQNKELEISKKGSPLTNSIILTDKIVLNHDQSSFSLDFAALSYTAPEMTEYTYTLEGLDNTWTSLKTNRTIYYTDLAPGEYTFKVKASNSSGLWNNKATQLKIEILPPFWASNVAYSFYLALVVILSFLLFRNYHQQTERKNKRKIDLLESEKEKEIYQAKIEFFTNVAHEIRTPLTLIKGPLEKIIKNTEEVEEVQFDLKTMEKNTQRLLDLTNQLLDFRKTEIKRFSLTFVKADVKNLLQETFSRFTPAAEQNAIHFTMDMPDKPLFAYIDHEAFIKIISNLFSNAIKYADRTVYVRLLPFKALTDQCFTIIVKNDGMVIPAEMRDKIFEPFFRLEKSENKTGTGIGLSLARSLAELHKGTLELDRLEMKMNIFALTLPVHQENEFKFFQDEIEAGDQEFAVEHEATSTKPAILIVDDQTEMIDFLTRDLSKEYLVLKAFDGKKALEVLNNENVQLVISDVMMPVMDGFELCRQMKTTLDFSHIPIILLTAKSTLKAKIEGLESGADAYIEKPFSPEHLQVQISNLLMNRNNIKNFFSSSPLAHIKSMAYTKADEHFLEKLDRAIYANIADTDLNVEHLAEMMNMSRPTLYRKIKALSDLTPNELINIARLKKAAELLMEGSYKVYEVAHIVGYNSQTSFGRNFLKQFGMTPTEYVNKELHKKEN